MSTIKTVMIKVMLIAKVIFIWGPKYMFMLTSTDSKGRQICVTCAFYNSIINDTKKIGYDIMTLEDLKWQKVRKILEA